MSFRDLGLKAGVHLEMNSGEGTICCLKIKRESIFLADILVLSTPLTPSWVLV